MMRQREGNTRKNVLVCCLALDTVLFIYPSNERPLLIAALGVDRRAATRINGIINTEGMQRLALISTKTRNSNVTGQLPFFLLANKPVEQML